MGRLIEADKLQDYFWDNRSKLFQSKECRIAIDNAPTVEAIPIPHDATNEDVLKAVFPNDADDIIKYIKAAILNGWLNSRYEGVENGNEKTTVNE